MKLVKKIKESLAQFAGEPNVITPDNSNEQADNYFIQNMFNNFLTKFAEGLICAGVEVSEGQIDVAIVDDTGDTAVLTFFEDEGVPYLAVSDLEDEFDAENIEDADEIEAFDISDLGLFDGYYFDFSKLDPSIFAFFIDSEIGDDSSGEIQEAMLTVIRGGKKVKKTLKRKKRRKPLTGKRKAAIRRAVLKRKKSQRAALRKRKRSLILRKRSKLKKKPKNFRV